MRENASHIIVENYYEPCILFLLSKKASYGYKLKKDLKIKLICEVNIGNLYRCLAKLHRGGYVTKYHEESAEGPERVMYKTTSEGLSLLQRWIHQLQREKKVVNRLISKYILQQGI